MIKATTSGILNHLKNKHKEEYHKLVPTFPKEQETTNQDTNVSNKPSTSKKQLTLEKCAEISKLWDINDPKVKKYHVLIAEMIALDNEVVNIVERAGFRRLINSALPRYNIPSRPYFSDNVIPEIYLLSIKHFEGQHIATNTAMSLQEIANLWDIREKIHIVIHDNGRNKVKAVSASARCFIHTIQLIVNDCLKVQSDVTQMIATDRKIVIHFNHSGTAQEKLHSVQKDLGFPQHELVQDVSTRWNSTYYMLERLMQQKRAISVYLTDYHIANLTTAQWELLEHLLKLLQPFEEITKLISSGYACISEIIPYVATLMRYYNKMSTSKELTTKLSIQRHTTRVTRTI
ncbi:zinc finger BED domain-containing protein 4 [Diorhabda carinulata]|uniref:zinc finger BED domain-containing protein 4 n=1 Tax=Diorhabda carinulata TaxID=1163345 RepID=UPI0025A207E1|nr:zinc finger BED domain-containing protein 4 [Diorhabda carinulata]